MLSCWLAICQGGLSETPPRWHATVYCGVVKQVQCWIIAGTVKIKPALNQMNVSSNFAGTRQYIQQTQWILPIANTVQYFCNREKIIVKLTIFLVFVNKVTQAEEFCYVMILIFLKGLSIPFRLIIRSKYSQQLIHFHATVMFL